MSEAQFNEAENALKREDTTALYSTASVEPLQVSLVHKNKSPFTKPRKPDIFIA